MKCCAMYSIRPVNARELCRTWMSLFSRNALATTRQCDYAKCNLSLRMHMHCGVQLMAFGEMHSKNIHRLTECRHTCYSASAHVEFQEVKMQYFHSSIPSPAKTFRHFATMHTMLTSTRIQNPELRDAHIFRFSFDEFYFLQWKLAAGVRRVCALNRIHLFRRKSLSGGDVCWSHCIAHS